jgi:predicted O-methyltransferase YrrM
MRRPRDPNELRDLPRALRAIRWRLPLELTQFLARLAFRPFVCCCDTKLLKEYIPERGASLEDTSVTEGQREVLLRALKQTENIKLPVVEIGAWHGVTTVALAKMTNRLVYAVDPYKDVTGDENDMHIMQERIRGLTNVKHIRLSSGEAVKMLEHQRFSLVFVDAIHDYLNTWFDFRAWGALVAKEGMMAFHDVDEFPGTNLACRRILKRKGFVPWGYCPNIVVFRRE